MYTYMHIFLFTIRTRLPNISSFVGVFVQHTQLTATTIRQRNDSCMIRSNSCIVGCDELHFQA
jgi:hypothetical protein